MPFTATITFTGLCGVVPQQDSPTDAGAFCFVLPNAWSPLPLPRRMSTIDGVRSPLRRHAAFIRFSTFAEDRTNHQRDLEAFWFLQGHRLEFKPDFGGGTVPRPLWGNVNGLASFTDVVGDPALLRVATVANNADHRFFDSQTQMTRYLLAAHTILSNGTLDSPPGNANHVFDNFLRADPRPAQKSLNHEMILTVNNLESLEVRRHPFAGGPPDRSIIFKERPLYITVANLCDENPLQWGDVPAPGENPDDDDFRWHYEIVDSPDNLRNALRNVGAPRSPIPRLAAGMHNGHGLNCDPIRYPSVRFT